MNIRKAVIGTLVAALLLGIAESRAVTLNWDATASSGDWEPAANWGGTSPPGSEILVFDNNVQTSMTNDAVNTTRNQIIFNAGAMTARTIGGSTTNAFVAVGLDNPLIQNNSTGSHVLNFPVSVGADGLTIDTVAAPLTLGGAVSGSGTVTKTGGSTLILSSNNTYAGATTITAGTVQVGSGGTSGSLGAAAIVNNATLTFNRSNNTTVANDISGAGALVKSGAGIMTMSGALTYAGATTINAGQIKISGNDQLPTGTVLTIANNNTAALDLSGRNQQVGSLNGGGAFGYVINSVGATTSVLAVSPTGEATWAGRIEGNIRLEVTGSNNLSFTNRQRLTNMAPTFSGGTRISGSAVFARGDGVLGAVPGSLDADNITLENGGLLLNDSGAALSLNANRGLLIGPGGGGLVAGFQIGLNVTVNGPISSAAGNTLSVLANTNTVIFNGDNSNLAGPLDLAPNARLQVGTGGSTGTLGIGVTSLGAGSILTFNRTGELTVATAMSGDGAVVKTGAGKVTLSQANTYTGTTTVSAGTLLVNGSTTASSLTTVQTGATLGGTGSVGATRVENGAFHSPGTSPGVQTFTAGLQYDAGSTLTWELFANTTAGRGTDYDGIDLTGGALAIAPGAILALDFGTTGAGSTIDWDDPFWGSDQSWTIVDVSGTGSWNGDLFDTLSIGNDTLGRSLATVRPNASFSVADVGGDLTLQYAAVPEPGAAALVAMAAAAALGFRRCRRLNRTVS